MSVSIKIIYGFHALFAEIKILQCVCRRIDAEEKLTSILVGSGFVAVDGRMTEIGLDDRERVEGALKRCC